MTNKIYIPVILLFNSIITLGQAPDWQWAKSEGGFSYDGGYAIYTDATGNSYVTGTFNSPSITFGSTTLINDSALSSDIFIAKYDPSGNVLWAKGAGGSLNDDGVSISADADGNSYITGSFESTAIHFGSITLYKPGSVFGIFVAKYDASGNEVWARNAGTGYVFDYGWGISTEADGNAYTTGGFVSPYITFGGITLANPSPGSPDVFIVKYDSSGNVVWANCAGGTGWKEGYNISTDASGNSYVTGYFMGDSITFGNLTLTNTGVNNRSVFVVKYDASGNEVWARTAGGTNEDAGYSITTDVNGNCYVTGYFRSDTLTFGSIALTNPHVGWEDIFVVKYDASGNVLWAKSAGGYSADIAYGITTDTDGDLYITGAFFSDSITFGSTILTNAGNSNFFVAKYDASGNVIWAKKGGGTSYDHANGISVDANKNPYITGDFQSPVVAFGNITLTNANSFGVSNDFFIAKLDNTTGIEEENNFLSTINVFPNPVFNLLNVNSGNKEISELILYDITSRKIMQKKFTNSISLNTEQLSKGLYLYELRNKDGSCRKGKVVKD